MNEQVKAKLKLIFAMSIFGTIGILRRNTAFPSGFIAMVRGIVGTVFLLLFVLVLKKYPSLADIKKNLLYLIFSGAFIGLNWILLFEAYNYTSVATATLCYYLAPVFIIIASPLVLKEKIGLGKGFCALLSFVGVVLISGVFNAEFKGFSELKGVFLGIGAAALYAAVIIINKKIKNISAYDKTIVQLGIAGLTVVPYVLFAEGIKDLNFTLTSVVLLLVMGIVHTGITYVMYFGTVDILKAQTIAVFSYIDPVVAIILSAVILKEHVGMTEFIGAVLILGSTLAGELIETKKTTGK